MNARMRIASVALVILLGLVTPAAAQDEKVTGWFDTMEFSFVSTSGNTESNTLGFKNKLWRKWEKALFELNAGAIRVQTAGSDVALCTSPDNAVNPTVCNVDAAGNAIFAVQEPDPVTNAENYFINGQYGRTITERFFWFAGAGWMRDRFAGIDSRTNIFGGVGNIWQDKEKVKWRTDYGVSYTDQKDVVEDPTTSDTFAGIRLSSTYKYIFGKTGKSSYGNDTIIDLNVDETEDWRVNMTNWVAVSMTDLLALKFSLQWLYDNLPSLQNISLIADGANGPVDLGTVSVPLDELDTLFTASLVLNF